MLQYMALDKYPYAPLTEIYSSTSIHSIKLSSYIPILAGLISSRNFGDISTKAGEELYGLKCYEARVQVYARCSTSG